ncbi:hypothetical protein CAEBREN_14754 [Caenorhabditis brenneri]|uniref:Uncharacterized protein n=1 Tax=Caenorhabditis brenneri TaxID=135651 RepID=G0MW36_CAEBE|nr:hypothetical protein CAEBREN_14754 [Caenorhabditis brenneri]
MDVFMDKLQDRYEDYLLIKDQQLRFQNLSNNAHSIDEILGCVVISKLNYMKDICGIAQQEWINKSESTQERESREFSMNHSGQGIFFMARFDQMIFEKSRIALYGES